MQFEFDSEIKVLEGKIKWNVFYFPYPAQEHFGAKGNVPVRITVDGHAFEHTLLPSRNGHYMVYNEFIKRSVNKEPGDTLHVVLEKDDRKREVAVPDHIEKAIRDAGKWEDFNSQPDYAKREQINHIELAKKEETKANRLHVLIERL